ncbi:MAG: ATP-binding protein [Lachnospiraceae bacterium]|nr:ATP-binding protein [Lachnospiraceae bacterium]
MALTVSQYNFIMRQYEERQTRNRHLREERLRHIYKTIAGYQQIDESVASVSVAQGRKMLAGDDNALKTLKEKLHELSLDRARLLVENGYPENFLQPVYDCPDCKDTGYINGQKCHCFRQAEIALLYEQSNLKQILEKENFSTLSYAYFEGDSLVSYRNNVEKCKKFASNFKTSYQNLFFYGTVGTGKTFLSNCIAKECIENGCSVIYFSAANLFDTLARNAYNFKTQEEMASLFGDLYSCDLLVIDDLGTETASAFTLSHFFTLLNERLLRKKSIIISTNLSLEDCRNRYQDRIFSRITSNFEFCKLTGPDIRMYRKVPGALSRN